MAGFEIGIDDEPEHVARARRQFGDRRGRHSMDLGMAGGWGKHRWNRLARSHDAAKTSCVPTFRIVYPVIASEAKQSRVCVNRSGLLRFARNDENPGFLQDAVTRLSEIGRGAGRERVCK